MANQKIEELLNLALVTPMEQREKSLNLNVGYDMETNTWDIIIKYHGDINRLEQVDERIQVVPLLNHYAVLTLPQEWIEVIADLEEVEYMEKPKRLYFELNQARVASCINSVQEGSLGLNGHGTIVAVLDSGDGVILMSECIMCRTSEYLKEIPLYEIDTKISGCTLDRMESLNDWRSSAKAELFCYFLGNCVL